MRYFDDREGSLNSPFCRRTGQGWRKLHGFKSGKKIFVKMSNFTSFYGQSRCTHFKIIHYCYSDKLGFFQKSEAIVRVWNKLRNQRKQLPGCGKSQNAKCFFIIMLVFFFQVSPCKFSKLEWVWPSPPLSGWRLPWRSPYTAQDPCAQIGHEPSPVWREVQPDKTYMINVLNFEMHHI